MEQLAQSNYNNSYVSWTDVSSRFRIYPLYKSEYGLFFPPPQMCGIVGAILAN